MREESNLTPLESLIVSAITLEDNPLNDAMRQQISHMRVVTRRFSGVGFVAELKVPASCPSVNIPGGCLGDVFGNFVGLRNGAFFTLFVKDGYCSSLECTTVNESFPKNPELAELLFLRKRNPSHLFSTSERG